MARKDTTTTPRSKVKNALRQCWLRSRERLTALKMAGYTCAKCGAKQSRAKGREVYVEVHHTNGINWDGLVDLVRERLLQRPENYTVLCKDCHGDEHTEARK
jgi:predicted HNH restriction endonuclease